MKAFRVLLLMIMLSSMNALAEQSEIENFMLEKTGFDKLQSFSEINESLDAADVFQHLMDAGYHFDPLVYSASVKTVLADTFSEMILSLSGCILPIVMSVAVNFFSHSKKNVESGLTLIIRIACLSSLTAAYLGVRDTATMLVKRIMEINEVMTPIMISAVTLTGATTTASILSPAASLCAWLITWIGANIGLPLAGIAAVSAIASSFSNRFRLNKLFELIKSFVTWMCGLSMTVFMGLMSVQGMIGNSHDTAAVRGMRYTAESIIPVIGGDISDTMDTIVCSVLTIKNCIGVTGMVLTIGICVMPLLKIGASMISVKLLAALSEPLADGDLFEIISRFGDVFQMLLIITTSCMVLVLLTLGAVVSAAGNIVA